MILRGRRQRRRRGWPARLRRTVPQVVDRLAHAERLPVGQADWLVNYAQCHHRGLRVGTAITEGTANFLVNRRMAQSQQMRWSRRGADLLLQVRCAVYNGTLSSSFGQRFQPANDLHPKTPIAACPPILRQSPRSGDRAGAGMPSHCARRAPVARFPAATATPAAAAGLHPGVDREPLRPLPPRLTQARTPTPPRSRSARRAGGTGRGECLPGRVDDRRGGCSLPVGWCRSFRPAPSVRADMAPFPVAAHRTGHAELSHPAHSRPVRPSLSAGR